MKYVAPALLFCQAAAFTVAPHQQSRTSSSRVYAGDYAPMEGEGKINLKVSPVLARCDSWHSHKMHLCN